MRPKTIDEIQHDIANFKNEVAESERKIAQWESWAYDEKENLKFTLDYLAAAEAKLERAKNIPVEFKDYQ